MFSGIRGRLISYYLVVIAVIVVIMGAFFIWFLNYIYMQTLQNNLLTQARLTSALIGEMFERQASPTEIDNLSKKLGSELGLRLTLISIDGLVLADSAENPEAMENHLSRPEIIDALNRGKGIASRYSSTVNEDMYYLAIPLVPETGDAGSGAVPPLIIRVALPLSSINNAVFNLKIFIIGALIFSSLLALGAAVILSQRITGPIRKIRSAAQAIAAGDYSPELKIENPDELMDLAEKINDMGFNLKLRMDQVLGEKNKLEKVISSMSSGIILTDRELRIELINPAAEKLFDTARQESIGKPLQGVIRNYTLSESLKALRLDKSAKETEIQVYYPSSALIECQLLPVTDPNEELIGVLLLFNEVTQIRTMEKMRSDFVANVSHELRTPLTTIRGYTETILHDELSREQLYDFLNIIERESGRLSGLLDDLLDLAQIENEKGFIHKEDVNLNELINEAVKRVVHLSQERGVAVNLILPADEYRVAGNFEWLCQALVNILENSIRYGRPQGEIIIKLDNEAGNAVVSVTDDGPGIPAVDLPFVFERFYRVDKARSRKSGGTGLGLSIVKHIMEAHHAVYSLDSVEGAGTTFRFHLPVG